MVIQNLVKLSSGEYVALEVGGIEEPFARHKSDNPLHSDWNLPTEVVIWLEISW